MTKLLCRVRVMLVATSSTDQWLDLSEFLASVGVNNIRGRIVLCEKQGNFRARAGIQTHTADPEAPNAPTPIGSGSGYDYVTSVTKQFVDFDPTGASNGDIDTKAAFRVGVLYSSTNETLSRGDVILELWANS